MDGPQRTGWRRVVPRRTVRLRLTALYGSLFLACGVLLLGTTYFLVRHDIGNTFLAKNKDGSVTAVFGTDKASGPVGLATVKSVGVPVHQGSHDSGFTQIRTGTVSASSSGSSSGGGSQVVQVPVPGVPPGKIPSARQAREQLAILRNQALHQQQAELHQLLLASGIALIAAALLSVVLGWIVAGRALRPLRVITAKAQDISSTNLHERIALRGPNDEVQELGDTFDELLGRLERSFDAQRQFVANASHELRTPLARQRTLLEVALEDPQADLRSIRTAASQAIAAGEEQEKILEALLTLASSERGLDRRAPFDLASVARRVVEEKAAEASLRGVRIDAELDPAPTTGNERLAQRAVSNLVENALRYNVDWGWIRVTTGTDGDGVVLHVSNCGPVVPPGDVERLFRPFERLTGERTTKEGQGLGLSIVAAVARAHGARLDARARPEGGLSIEIAFPVADTPAGALASETALRVRRPRPHLLRSRR